MRPAIGLLAAALITGCLARREAAATGEAPAVSAGISFRCLWWSEEQKGKFNPNNPPPKTTEVVIQKWEYSDPVEVPHPDVVDVVVEVRSEARAPAEGMTVSVRTSWLTGPVRNRAAASWSRPTEVLRKPGVKVDAGGKITLRVPVDLARKMAQLRPGRSWPWALRVEATVAGARGQTMATAKGELPITPGD